MNAPEASCAATYFGGKYSVSHPVSIVFARETLRIVGREIDITVDRCRVRISQRIAATPRWLYLPDGGACCVPDNDAVDRIAQITRMDRRLHHWESRPALAALALLLVAAMVGGLVKFGVPLAAREVAEHLPAGVESRLGGDALAGLDRGWTQTSGLTAERQAGLRAGFDHMRRLGGDQGAIRLEFRASRAIGPNALALPGGVIVITDELVALARNDDEILGVLAHELGHVRLRHAMRRLLEGSAAALVIAGITGDVATSSSLAASAAVLLLQSKFSRDNETEADRFAIDLMRKAAVDPKHLAILLARLESKSGGSGELTFLSSHPPSAERKALALAASTSREDVEAGGAAGR